MKSDHINRRMSTESHSDVASIMRHNIDDYISAYGPLPLKHQKIVRHVTACRTEAMGGHHYVCDSCGDSRVSYNSCRDRHCPQCQGLARAHWVARRSEELLPVGYFHVVFTMPHELNAFAIRNKQQIYDILFRSVSETLVELGRNPRWLGGQIGAIAVLHTWGQNLLEHPHVHCIVPGGGIRNDQKKWVSFGDKYLFPIDVMSALFRGKFLCYFKNAVQGGDINFCGLLKEYENQEVFKELINALYAKKWVVYAKEPFADAQCVVKYLGRYTHRIAISNQRIIQEKDQQVSFRWKDYADNNKCKVMTITGVEFLRRFFLHVLPDKYTRIRYVGFLSNSTKNKRLEQALMLLKVKSEKKRMKALKKVAELFEHLFGIDITKCHQCATGHYRLPALPAQVASGYT